MRLILALIILPLLAMAQKGRPQRVVVCTGGGSATVATCTPSPALAALSDLSTTPRTLVSFTPTANSTGAMTLAINGLTATALRKYVGGAAQAIAADDLRASTSYMLEYDGTYFIVKSVLGNGGSGGGTGDVVGPASAVNNTVAIYDSTTGKLIKSGTGCTIASATLTCTGGFVSGDGTTESAIILKELAANGSNDFRIYGAANQAADGCLVFSGPLASGDAWRGSASTVTDSDGKTCRVMETYTPGAGGGGGAYHIHAGCRKDVSGGRGCEFGTSGGSITASVLGSTNASELVALVTTATSGEKAGIIFTLPVTPTTWTATVELVTSSTSTVDLTFSKVCMAPGAAATNTLVTDGAAVSVTPASGSALAQRLTKTLTVGSCAAGDMVNLVVSTNAVITSIVSLATTIQ